MIKNLLRKGGVPALISAASDTALSLPCTLQVKCGRDSMHDYTSIHLVHSTPIRGYDGDTTFTFLYHAEDLVPGQTFYTLSTTLDPNLRPAEMAQGGDPKWISLTLALIQPCPIVCPESPASFAPKAGYESHFCQLTSLAKTTEVLILVDLKWFNPQQRSQFEAFIRQPEKFKSVPFDKRNAQGRKQADWSVFGPIEDVGHAENPPSYAEAALKRPRAGSSSSTHSPPTKRLLGLPLASIGSPTEKATTVSSLSPRLPSSPAADIPPHFEERVIQLLEQMLPGKLSDLLTKSRSSLSPSPTSSSPSLTSKPKPRSFLSSLLFAHAQSKLDAIYAQTADYAYSLRSVADDEFLDTIQEHKTDVEMIKEDTLAELQKVIDEKLDDFRQSAAEIVEEATEQIDEYAREKLDTLVGRNLARPRGIDKEYAEKHSDRSGKRRAASLPL